jgi:hypothetical protein
MFALPEPHYLPCVEYGASVARNAAALHVCGQERRLDFAVFWARAELDQLEEQLSAYLETPSGRFEAWYAARRR